MKRWAVIGSTLVLSLVMTGGAWAQQLNWVHRDDDGRGRYSHDRDDRRGRDNDRRDRDRDYRGSHYGYYPDQRRGGGDHDRDDGYRNGSYRYGRDGRYGYDYGRYGYGQR